MTSRFFALPLTLLLACSDDTSATGAGGTGGAGGNAAQGGQGGTPSLGGGGEGGEGGQVTSGGGGAGSGCPAVLITDGEPEQCVDDGPLATPLPSTTICPADSGVFWPAKLFRVPVSAGDCLHMRADNVGSPLGADLFGAIVDPSGTSLLFDEEVDCTVPNPDGYACPEGATTVAMTGEATIIVGAWEGGGCTPMEDTPFELTVAINGVDVDLSGSELCAGDLLEIIP